MLFFGRYRPKEKAPTTRPLPGKSIGHSTGGIEYSATMFEGTYTALVTPFDADRLDNAAFRALIEAQVGGGVDGIVPVGTTGESPTLDYDEHHEVIERAVEFANKRCKVIAGTGSNSTREAIDLTRQAEKSGVDGALLVAPYYNKPSQEGLFQHYCRIAESTSLPIVLYSIPGRCGIEIGVETVARLAEACPNIRCIKEAGGSVERVSQLRQTLPEDFTIVSGDDSLTLPFLSVGAAGVISVASNLIPAEVVHLVAAFRKGKPEVAEKLHRKLYPLFKDLFLEPNPVPAKYALARMGRMNPDVRLPLCAPSRENAARIEATLRSLSLL